ncbi:prolyl oligopeptidase family serine peptidase [Pelodictyon luteolum]|uniref:prolyl oligopeptidase n=1 Tax=Chlorobium luteolum (strain DSM 273 / BCRC 81028 / 2530) TaxID=319225 RepID=Q3B4S7_CHLL3|nr:prolyl oligopeptidase family serine peptidase [Pelodictyon luteolum]ABB23654.1 oligopeptidase B, Serine peptidase, MEROPS family S09A [Pelodictyon luteolum DSM 273]
MTRSPASLLIVLLFASLLSGGTLQATEQGPAAPRVAPPCRPHTETLCGVEVSDPFRPLEDFSVPAVAEWVQEQSEHARAVLESIPGRGKLLRKMEEFDLRRKSKAYSLSITDNDRYFYLKETPGDETGKLYLREGFKGRETLLFDPGTLDREKGTRHVISHISPSDDGLRVAVSVSANGSEDDRILIMDVDRKQLYPEIIDRCRFASPSWTEDGTAFIYNRLRPLTRPGQNPQYDSQVFLHRAGTDPKEDIEIFSAEKYPELQIAGSEIPGVTYDRESGRLFAFVSSVERRLRVYTAPSAGLLAPKIDWKPLIRPEDEIHDFATTATELYVFTPKNAPRFRILKTPLERPDFSNAETVVGEDPDALLTSFSLTRDALYFTRSRHGVEATMYRLEHATGKVAPLTLPFRAGSAYISSKGPRFRDIWVTIAGWSSDYRRYRYLPETGTYRKETISSSAEYPEYRNMVVEEVMVPSHDGTMVPLSLVYRKGLKRNGENPVLLYGYGAYGKSISPFFSPSTLLWTTRGGIFAIAHVRGGGELGDRWHVEGMKEKKPNTWKDAIASAEYLVRNGYTKPGKIVLNGASAGGIMVGMAMAERPELFGAVIPQVGAMNPLRGEKTPNGPVNVPEFGTVHKEDECRALIAMDPYLNIQDGTAYPAALVTTGLNDPRVSAWQPAKFAARLQQATTSAKPVLFFADRKAGHGMGNTKSKTFESLADVLSFGLWQTGDSNFQPEH